MKKKEFIREISKIKRNLEKGFDYVKSARVRIHRRNHPARFGLAFEPHQIEVDPEWPDR